MENIFLKYMSDRVKEDNQTKESGPVITLSRQYGCYASKIAQMLTERLSAIEITKKSNPWICLSKEILDDAAQKLQVDPQQISHIFGADEKHFLGDLVVSFSSKQYASDSNIKKTITTVVKSYAEQGNVVIVGRAGCVVTKHIQKSLHIRLIAPTPWRIEQIMQRFNIKKDAAKKQVEEFDKKRETFMEFFKGNKPDCELYDAIFNRATLTDYEIVESITRIAEIRKLV